MNGSQWVSLIQVMGCMRWQKRVVKPIEITIGVGAARCAANKEQEEQSNHAKLDVPSEDSSAAACRRPQRHPQRGWLVAACDPAGLGQQRLLTARTAARRRSQHEGKFGEETIRFLLRRLTIVKAFSYVMQFLTRTFHHCERASYVELARRNLDEARLIGRNKWCFTIVRR